MVDEGTSMSAPAFAQNSMHKTRSIHVPVELQGMEATTLIDYGVIDNFVNRSFMRKRGLQPELLQTPRTCKLGKGLHK